ncbi:vascular cell adhesion protein 1 isoform X1 [Pangasianodon hypophthalmus]|uniref:vascular cell adhesion protein 1 isoform X1 n=1 Tax=Pangasianodon hypophthalmus TaxID=310915 RepID=UPI002307C94A|nr:vascular cell adhesion protein 1 isoform X1 [Pangasianodon hypophthalmus]
MVSALCVTLTVLLQCILCYTPVSSFEVELSPKKPLFRVGDRQELTCRMIKCSEKMTFSWSNLEDKPMYAETQRSSTGSTLVFKSVSKNIENKIQCKATCLGMIKQAAVTVRVYSFPKVPVISGHDSLVLGKENSLTCEVSDVYPAEHMTVEWLRGGKVVHTQEGEYGIESIQSYYTFTPQTNDDGESITCRATLSLDGLPPEERTREITVSMAVLCPPMNTVISVSPNNPKENEFMNISCVSDSNHASRLVLSKMLDGKETELVSGDGPRVSVSYDKANLNHSGVYVCRTTNACGRQTDNVTFTVGISSFEVELSPKKPLFRVGDRQELTCRMIKCSEKMTFSWSSLEDKPMYAEPQTTSTGSTLVFKSVSKKNEDMIQCKATCQGTSKQAAVTVRVYSFPKVPVISGHDSLVLGKENSLTCEVSDVYPAENMTVEWLRGGKVVHTQEGEYGIESIQSYYTFTPQTNDDGESITCRATLSLDGLPPEERTREITVSMAVLCPPMNTVISVSPNNPKENEFMNISCVSDSNLASRLVLSKMLDGKETELVSGDGPRVSVSYDKANLNHSGVYVCRTTNACGRQTDNVTFTVGISSFKVELSPKKPLFRVGDRQELTCRTSKCSDKMTFSWSSLEDKPLYAEPQTSSTESTLVFKSVSENTENKIQCKATCLGMLKQAAVTVRVYSFPKVPVISGHDSLVLGKENSLTCEVSDVYPAEHMTVEWLRGGKVVRTQEGEYGIESIQSYYTFTPQTNDDGESITCRATLSLDGLPPEERTREITVSMAVLSFPKVPVISGHDSLVLGKENSLTCEVSDVYPAEHMTVEWLRGGKVVHTQEGEYGIESIQSYYTFTPQTNDDGESITCRATLSLDGLPTEERTRETTVTIAVLSPPRNTTMKNTKDDGNVYTALLRRLNSIDVIIPVIGMGVLASVASSLNCVRKAARKGLSCLNKGTPETV